MSNFEYFLQEIASDVSSPKNSMDIGDFVTVKDYILFIMREQSSYFADICQNDVLFGSAAHNVRLYNDDEFDVLMELSFPAFKRIRTVLCKDRPGFTFLDFSEACYDNMVGNKLANNDHTYLSGLCLKSWLDTVFQNALRNYGNVVDADYERYSLKYIWRGITYTIYARSSTRSFSIDFVPAVKIVRPNSSNWHAIPKQCKNGNGTGNSHLFTFMLSNTQAELQIIDRCGETLKDALHLLQALRNSKDLKKLRCYHLVTVAIWLSRRLGHSSLDNLSLSDTFLMLLSDLCDAFIEGRLSNVWDCRMNLLGHFTPGDMSKYTGVLCCAYNTLKSYTHQPALRFGRCQQHFQ